MFNAVVPCSESLYIEPGVSLTGNLLVNGYLEAIGTLSDSILIYDGSITIKSDSLCSQANAYIEYFFLDAARIQCNDSARVILRHGLLANISYMLTADNGTELVVDSCNVGHIILNGGRVFSLANSNVELKNSIFNGTNSMCQEEDDGYGGHYYFMSPLFRSVNNNITIDRCVFSNNWGVNTYDWGCDQVAMFGVYGSIWFNNCIFINNHADWTSMYSFSFPAFIINTGDTALFNNCIFYQSYGIGRDDNQIMNKGGAINISNCNFRFSGVRTESGNSDVLNSVFYVSPIIVGDNYLHNCLVPPGTSVSDSSSVFFGTPTFISDTSYMLAPTSIGIDMGAEFAVTDSGDTIWAPATDFYGNPRPSGTGFDIGAAEYQWEDYSPTYHCYSGWNLVSNPLAGTHFMTELLDSIDSPLFGYNNETGYYYETIMRQGSGYWVLISDENSTEISSDVIDSIDITLSRGWNLIGGPGGPVDLSHLLSSESIIAPVYGYDADEKNYFETSVILPGRGYWLLSEIDTTFTIHR